MIQLGQRLIQGIQQFYSCGQRMSDIDWSRIVKEQDQHVHEQDKKQSERRLRMKQMYKNQLLKIIGQQRDKAEDEKNQDRSLIKWINQKEKTKLQMEDQIRIKNQRLKEEIARYNLNSNLDRRNKMTEENEEFSKFYARKYEKANTQIEQEKRQKIRSKSNEKQSLSKAYDSQMSVQKNKKLLQKLEDQKFVELREQIERKKQQDRKKYYDKIRNHKQNPEVYELSKNLMSQKQRQRIEFIQKLANQDRNGKSEQEKKKQQEEKLKKVIEASKYNRNYYQSRHIQNRLQSMQETEQIHNTYKTLQQEMLSKRQNQLREKASQRSILKNTLEKQIDQAHMRQSRKYKLSQKEERLNKSGEVARLPGILKDSSSEKHYEILYSFLGGRLSTKN